MSKYYCYIKWNNGFEGGFDREIEANTKEEAIEKFKDMLNENILPRRFDIYDNPS